MWGPFEGLLSTHIAVCGSVNTVENKSFPPFFSPWARCELTVFIFRPGAHPGAQQGPPASHRVCERGGRRSHRPVETRQAPEGMRTTAPFVLPSLPTRRVNTCFYNKLLRGHSCSVSREEEFQYLLPSVCLAERPCAQRLRTASRPLAFHVGSVACKKNEGFLTLSYFSQIIFPQKGLHQWTFPASAIRGVR